MYSVLLLFRQLRAAAVFVYVCVYINNFLFTYIVRRCLFERCVYLYELVPIHVSLLISVFFVWNCIVYVPVMCDCL